MRASKLAVVLLSAAAAAAAADDAADRAELVERAQRARQSLGALERRAGRLEGKELRKALKEVARAAERLDGLSGKDAPAAQAEEAAKEEEAKKAERRGAEADALGRLHLIRAALKRYYDDHDGLYPERLSELAPKYLDWLPDAVLPDHPAGEAVHLIKSFKGDKPDPYVKDSGGWLYFRDNEDHPVLGGQVLLDCRHRTKAGREFYKY